MRLAKIVCTIGPASSGVDNLCRMIEAGMDVARLNFSHGDHDSHRQIHDEVREAARRVGRPVGVLADISGPKIRLREVRDGAVEIRPGEELVLTTEDIPGDARRVGVNFASLPQDVRVGDALFIDDGMLELEVLAVHGQDVRCTVKVGGTLRSRKGLNLPHVALSTPAITAKDCDDMAFGRSLGVDYFALSFVRHAADVREAQSLAGRIPVIAKIEKPQAIEHLEDIADVADGCMVARGDLGIEVGQHKVPLLQKRIIREMNERAKPVITATQMLESMVGCPQPTRAEVSDVANAVLDGTDALMLSAESAVGRYPVLAVQTMARIIEEVEAGGLEAGAFQPVPDPGPPAADKAVARATARTVIHLGLKAVAVYTDVGQGARLVSAQRPTAVILALCHDDTLLHRLTLLWGVIPVVVPRPGSLDEAMRTVERTALDHGLLQAGDDIAMTFTFEKEYDPRLTSGFLLHKIGGGQ